MISDSHGRTVTNSRKYQANYINALAVSISPIFEPAGPTLGELFFPPWVNLFMTLGELFKSGGC
jgi:hypothetical protein